MSDTPISREPEARIELATYGLRTRNSPDDGPSVRGQIGPERVIRQPVPHKEPTTGEEPKARISATGVCGCIVNDCGCPPPLYVYFIGTADPSLPIKIGKAKDVRHRFANLKVGSPVPLQILASVPGGKRLEWELHARLRESRSHGEWFRPTPELLGLIERLRRAKSSFLALRVLHSFCGLPDPRRPMGSVPISEKPWLQAQLLQEGRIDELRARMAEEEARDA
jgi:hypothetical protein